jgi:hypothetical protein
MDCPVCNHKNLPDAVSHCPNCGGDLRAVAKIGLFNTDSLEVLRQTSVLKGRVVELKSRLARKDDEVLLAYSRQIALWLFFGFVSMIGCGIAQHHYRNYDRLLHSQRLLLQRTQLHARNSDTLALRYKKLLFATPPKVYIGRHGNPALPLTRTVLYVVEAGDELELVSTFFFGDNSQAHRIGFDNQLDDHNYIVGGDTLVINPIN